MPGKERQRGRVTARMLTGLAAFCSQRKVAEAYVITRGPDDLGLVQLPTTGIAATALKIPAPLACYWLGRSEILATRLDAGR